MKVDEKLGIWMDHAQAHLIAFSAHKTDIRTLFRTLPLADSHAQNQSEKHIHNKKRQLQEAFYRQIWDIAKQYDEVLLFGPTDAKTEFFNGIRSDHANNGVKITLRSVGKMTPDEMHDYVYKYFKPLMLP